MFETKSARGGGGVNYGNYIGIPSWAKSGGNDTTTNIHILMAMVCYEGERRNG